MATLAAVIGNLVLLNLNTSVGCTVCAMFQVRLAEFSF
jgi:hypothetical protein